MLRSGKQVNQYMIVSKYWLPDEVLGKGPTQLVMTWLKGSLHTGIGSRGTTGRFLHRLTNITTHTEFRDIFSQLWPIKVVKILKYVLLTPNWPAIGKSWARLSISPQYILGTTIWWMTCHSSSAGASLHHQNTRLEIKVLCLMVSLLLINSNLANWVTSWSLSWSAISCLRDTERLSTLSIKPSPLSWLSTPCMVDCFAQAWTDTFPAGVTSWLNVQSFSCLWACCAAALVTTRGKSIRSSISH